MEKPTAEGWNSHVFLAGELRFRIEADTGFDRSTLNAFDGLPQVSFEPGATTTFAIRRVEDDQAAWSLDGPNCPHRSFLDPLQLLDSLVAAVNLSALDADPAALHLHAAAASLRGDGALIVGESGTGKTTLVANLAASGWDYITDEMIRLESGTGSIVGFAKPLSIKPTSFDLIAWSPGERRSVPPGTALQVSPIELGFSLAEEARPRLILCTHPDNGAGMTPSATRIGPADAVVRMMSQTMDAERYGNRTLGVLARLAADCRCYDVSVGDPDLMVAMVNDLMAAGDEAPPAVEMVSGGGGIADDVTTAFIGDSAVIRHDRVGTIAALDAPGCLVWRTIGDLGGHAEAVDLSGPVESRFIDQLASMGFLGKSAKSTPV